MESLRIKCNVNTFEFTSNAIKMHGGAGLLQHYNGSLSDLLKKVFPQYEKVCREAIEKLMTELKLENVEDLTKLPREYLTIQWISSRSDQYYIT